MAKKVAVIGATGIQGSSVVQAILDSPDRNSWSIRAVTRDGKGKTALTLQGQGVEIFEADLDSLASLKAGFADCYAVFAVTDFFVPFAMNGANAKEAIEVEWKRASNIADAVSANPSIKHFIWSTLPHAGRISGGQCHPAHFVAKNRLDDRIKQDPNLLKRTTFLWVGWYATNFLYPVFAPTLLAGDLRNAAFEDGVADKYQETAGKYVQLGPVGADVPIASIGDPKTNLGPFVLATLQQPQKTLRGRFVLAITEEASMNKLVAAWSEVTGKEALFVQCSVTDYERLWPGWGSVEGEMLRFYNDFGGQVGASEDSILTAADLGVPVQGATSVVDAIRAAVKNPA